MPELLTPTRESTDQSEPSVEADHDRGSEGSGRHSGLLTALARQLLRPRALLAVVAGLLLIYVLARRALDVDLGVTWSQLRHAHAGFLLLGLVVFYLVYLVRAARWQVLLANVGLTRDAGYRLPSFPGLVRLMVIAAFANSLTVAQLGDAYRAYLLKKEARVSFAVTLGTVLAERIVDVIVLVAMLSVAALVAFAGRVPRHAIDMMVLGLAIAVVGIVFLTSLRQLRPLAERLIPNPWRAVYRRFEVGTIDSLRRIALLVCYSAVGWLVEGATIYLLAAAVAAPLSASGALVAALLASLLSVEPFTPGGLGATETGIVLVLTALGVSPDTAAAVAVLNRIVNYMSLAVVGPFLCAGPWLGRMMARRAPTDDLFDGGLP